MPSLFNLSRFPGVIGTFMGRDALCLASQHLGLTDQDAVLLPVYTCQDVIKAFLRKNRVLLYDIKTDLSVDPDEIQSKLHDVRIKLAVITDYFGFLQPHRGEIKKICADRGVSLLEDCAHSLFTRGAGETGDVAIYSFRKLVPLPDGGGLRVNSGGTLPSPRYYPTLYSNALSALLLIRSIIDFRPKMLSRGQLTSRVTQAMPASSQVRNERLLPISSFAQRLLARASFSEIIEKKRKAYRFWQDVARRSDVFEPVFPDLPADVCPFGFAIRSKVRNSLESEIGRTGVKLSVHWRVDKSLAKRCDTSIALSNEMLTLPLDGDPGWERRDVIASILTGRSLKANVSSYSWKVQQ